MASAPLNWLLKIGGDALTTVAQTISGAINELKSSKADKATIYSQTLLAGATSVTFTNVTTTANSSVQVGTSVAGLDYNDITQSGTSYTVTFDSQASNVTVYLLITEVA